MDEFRTAGCNEGHKRRNCGADRKSELAAAGTRTLWMPGLVPAIHSNYCNTPTRLKPHVPHGLVPIDVPRKMNRWPMCCITLSPTDMWYATTLAADSTTQAFAANVTEHCGRFFWVFRIFHLLTPPPWGCHNACPSLYLILCLAAPFH